MSTYQPYLGAPNFVAGMGYVVNESSYTSDDPNFSYGLIPEQAYKCGAYTIRIFNRSLEQVAYISSNMKCGDLLSGSSFTLDEKGALSATLILASPAYRTLVRHRDLVYIYLNNSNQPTFRGFVSGKTAPGDTSDTTRIRCLGLNAQLKWGCVTGTFSGARVYDIVQQLLPFIAESTDIQTESAAVDSSAKYVVGNIEFKGTTYDQTLTQLASLAGAGFKYGVDERGILYFRNMSRSPGQVTYLRQGRDFDTFTLEEDSSRLFNQYLVRHPSATGSGFLDRPLEDVGSIRQYGYRCKIFSSPSTLDPVDAYRAASVELANTSSPEQRADIGGLLLSSTPITVPGTAVIDLLDGSRYELDKAQITYTFSGDGVQTQLKVGQLPPDLIKLSNELASKQARQEILDRTNA